MQERTVEVNEVDGEFTDELARRYAVHVSDAKRPAPKGGVVRKNRRIRRAELRRAYDVLGDRWRRERRKRESILALLNEGDETKVRPLGPKPRFHLFAQLFSSVEDPVTAVRASSVEEIIEWMNEEFRRLHPEEAPIVPLTITPNGP
jgi:hypothetical protein